MPAMVRLLMKAFVELIAVVDAYGNIEAIEDVAMNRSDARELVPVAVSFEPFHVRMVLLADIPDKSRPIVPAPVMVPPVKPLFVAMDVTVPFVRLLKHLVVPVIQMRVASMPPANVDDAVPNTVRVLVAMRLAREMSPENKPLPCTDNVDRGVVVPIPSLVALTVNVGIAE